jgi:hypothetical protein
MGIRCRRVNMVQILCIHVVNGKMRTVETILRTGRGRIKENYGGSEFNYDIL